jgi:hypothetical protein
MINRLLLGFPVLIMFAAGCGTTTVNTPANVQAVNGTSYGSSAPTAETLLALDRQATEAYFKGDAKHFEGMLNDEFVTLGRDKSRLSKAAAIKMIGGLKCDIKDGWKLDEPHVSAIDADTYILNYKGTFDGNCAVDGKTWKAQSPVRAATVWSRSGGKWTAAFHGENQIVDAAAPPKVGDKPEAQAKEDKDANLPGGAAPVEIPLSDDLVAVERSVWEAWKVMDGRRIEELTNKDLSFVDIFGNVFSTKAETSKVWTEHGCKVQSVNVSDGVQRELSQTVRTLTFTGNAEGSCYGQEMTGAIYGTSLYVRNGDTWKLAFTMNSL